MSNPILLGLVLPALAALSCLGAALAIIGIVRMNKGAKMNVAWILMALGLIMIAAGQAQAPLVYIGLPHIEELPAALEALGAVLILCGAVYARSIFKRLLK